MRFLPDRVLDLMASVVDWWTERIDAAIFAKHTRRVERKLRKRGFIDRDGHPTKEGEAWLHGDDGATS